MLNKLFKIRETKCSLKVVFKTYLLLLSVQFSTEGEEAMHPELSGGPLDSIYRLEQLHFHWMSEHAINGVKYDNLI